MQLEIHSFGNLVGYVDKEDGEDPCMTLVGSDYFKSSLTFSEIEHIMDCWHNRIKN